MSLVSMRNISMVALLASISGVGLARQEESSEDCRLEADAIARGLKSSFSILTGEQPSQSLRLTLIDKSDTITYSLEMDYLGSIQKYSIELDNDSASKCLPLSVTRMN